MAFTRITVDPDKMSGVPCIRGLRIPVATVVEMVAEGMSEEEILEAYPDLEPEDVREALRCGGGKGEGDPASFDPLRFLIENAFSPVVAEELRRVGHEALHIRDRGMQVATDEEISELASRRIECSSRPTPTSALCWRSEDPPNLRSSSFAVLRETAPKLKRNFF